ncbi:response regulator transcription factor [Actinomadura sp. NTSP31]|uniref:helix-turn-helix transcriptional regulator n=1 Tax=Actinomadura sp. NTSP31 TaxID=1735447 RepID=UPI0035BECE85
MNDFTASRIRRGRDGLISHADQALDALDMFGEVSTRLRALVPFDASVWRATDPLTGLMTAPVRIENLQEGGSATYWDNELLAENINLFSDLARATVPAAALRESTGDMPERSPLYRGYLRPRGLGDELRAVLRVGGRPWGHISLFREEGRPSFTASEITLVAGLSLPLARRLRSFARPSAGPDTTTASGPGLLLFDSAGALISVNDDARRHLDDLPSGPSSPTPLGIRLPAWIHGMAVGARAKAEAGVEGGAEVRIRDQAGRWLVCRASCMRGAGGSFGHTALVIEPATSVQVGLLTAEACGLSERELEITQAVARGLTTGEIAQNLFISVHTVRDHLKAIFRKAGVSSRGELIATLFADHYQPAVAGGLYRTSDR